MGNKRSVAGAAEATVVVTGGKTSALQVRCVRRDGWTKPRRKLFIETLARTCNVRLSASTAKMNVSTAYDLRHRDAGFARQWQDALAIGYERLETALVAHAMQVADAIEVEPVDEGDAPVRLSHQDVQSALAILKRRDDLSAGRGRLAGRRRPSAEEVNDDLTRRLDLLARQLGYL